MIYIELLTLFILKLLDNCLSTLKTLLLVKNKNALSALANAIAQFFYLMMMVKLTQGSSTAGIVVICLSSFIGAYLPQLLFDKLSRDKVFIFDIIPPEKEDGEELADELRENNIPIQTYKGYNASKEKVLCVKVFSGSREESILIEQLIPKGFSYNIIETKKYFDNI